MRSVLAVLALIVGLSIASLTPAAQAEQARAAQKTYMAKIQEGIAQVRSEAYDQALSTFREAKEAEPQRAEAIYYEAVTLRLKGEEEAALEAFRRARVISKQAGNARMEARSLQGAAQILERHPESLDEARTTWLELAALLREHPNAGVAAVPAARIEAIDHLAKANANAAITKKRVAEREEELRQEEAKKAKKKR